MRIVTTFAHFMKVYKFGGASIADAGRMAALLPIISEEKESLLIVISAMGKTTNALERIVQCEVNKEYTEADKLASELKQQHLAYAETLLNADNYAKTKAALEVLFVGFDKAIKKADNKRFDYSYDQIVCMGELFSSCLLYGYLSQNNLSTTWVDIRKVLITDDTYRDAVIDWNRSALQAEATIGRELKKKKIVVTQGFIGATTAGDSVTLGREGSDYTAAVLAAMLHMDSVTIWKDVDGFRNADPKLFPGTVKIDTISYAEVIEMAFYGAQIIHPKTIKPLHNNNIPLYVKCFLDKNLTGSVIKAGAGDVHYPPMIVLKDKQVLVQVTTRDFSFITEDNLSSLYSIFNDLKVKINLIQNAAISFVACIDNREDKVIPLIKALSKDYKVTINEQVSLLTVRHFTREIVEELTKGHTLLLRQETRKTLQVVMK
jgi:aspartate kinase